ncbi:MAG: BON domain-containing protein [Gammaproteobacteria bacterium]|nr:BON domain-containing protein [Gammaproteobacteria bacterium]
MKTLTKSIAAAVVLVGMAGSASAMTLQQDIFSGVQSAVGSSANVSVSVNGDVATLSGYVEDLGAQNAAIRAAKDAGAERVIDLITHTN